MNDDIDRLVQEVIEIAALGDPRAIQKKGLEVKQAVWTEGDRLQLAINIVDGIVTYKAKGLPWTIGWVNPSAAVQPAVGPSPVETPPATAEIAVRPSQAMLRKQRTARVLYLANEAVDSGNMSITTAVIAAILQRDGDTTAIGSLQTGVGNILNRTGNWKRIRTGEYEYIDREGVV